MVKYAKTTPKLTEGQAVQHNRTLHRYPSLVAAIAELRTRMDEVDPEYLRLLEKWTAELEQIEKDMRHLERIEKFTRSVTAD